MPVDFYHLGADDAETTAKRQRVEPLAAIPAESSKAAWAIGLGIAMFIGLPVLLNSMTDLVRAAKE